MIELIIGAMIGCIVMTLYYASQKDTMEVITEEVLEEILTLEYENLRLKKELEELKGDKNEKN